MLVGGELAGALIGGAATLGVAGVTWAVTLKTTRTFSEERALSVAPGLFEARIASYGRLWELTEVGQEPTNDDADYPDAASRAADMRRWYYEKGAGLLLSDDAQALWFKIRLRLDAPPVKHRAIWSAMSLLRTELKLDLQVRDGRVAARRSERAKYYDSDINRLTDLRQRSEDVVKANFPWPSP